MPGNRGDRMLLGMQPNSTSRSPVLAIALLATASAFLGGAMATAKLAVADVPPMTVAATRFALATLVLLTIRQLLPRLRGTTSRPQLRDLPIIGGLGMTAAAGYNILLLSGVRLAPASDAAMIGPAVAPIVSTLLAAVLLHERPRALAVVGLVVSIAGILLVMSPSGAVDGSRLAGDLIFVAAGALFGSYLVLSRFAARRFSPLDITLYGSMFGAIVLLPFALLEGGPGRLMAAGPSSLLAIGHLALLATVAAFMLLNEGLRRLGVSRSAGFTMMIPVFGVLQAMVLLGEPLAGTALIGAVVVLAGIWLSQGGSMPSLRFRRVAAPAPVRSASPA